jgi:hypothetical protein
MGYRPREKRNEVTMRREIVFIPIISLGIAVQVTGRTRHVAPSGSDAANGSSAAPWLTLQHAADSVRAGDTIIVSAGAYKGFQLGWDNPQNGTPANPILFRAEPGVIINDRNVRYR